MLLLLVAVGLLVLGGAAALLYPRARPEWCTTVGAGTAVAGCLLGLIPTAQVLLGAPAAAMRCAWDVPAGAFSVQLDALSAYFLLPIFGISGLAAVYGRAYLGTYRDRKWLGPPWFFFNVLVASMVLVVVARNAVLFLVAWEVMALASFCLVTFEDERAEVRDAGWTYLAATHLGTACLLAFFVLLGRGTETLDFDHLRAVPDNASLLFLLAVIGFGTKAGFVPLHVWLPEAHPAAPSHVSAVMSGVMIKTGIYGLVRVLTVLGPPPPWWGWVLCGLGVSSGIFGIVFALAQSDLKRVLAYSSVENVGIIALGLGVGVVGLSADAPVVAALGFGGALLHVLNHALCKGLLFLGAGAVAHATGTREMDRLGGLLRRMPQTASAFLLGAAAIAGVPPLNGFAGELLIFLAALHAVMAASLASAVPGVVVVGGLALISGLAAACFTRAVGVVCLGEARSAYSAHVIEPERSIRLPMLLLAAGCVIVGLLAPAVLAALAPVIASATRLPLDSVRSSLAPATVSLAWVVWVAVALLVVSAGLAGLRRRLLAERRVDPGVTWDCGYARPAARMQYTAASFAQPLTELFAVLLRTRRTAVPPAGIFPRTASLIARTPDLCTEGLYRPLFRGVGRAIGSLRWLQHGRVNLYVLYVALTLLALLIWKLG